MPTEVMVALLSLLGTLAGSLSGVLMANRLCVYRIEQLEKKVDKHNNLVERMAVMERDMQDARQRIGHVEAELENS